MKLDVRELSKQYGDTTIFENLNFHVEEGEFLTILGPSGCGKSTILNLIIGSLTKTSGEIFVDGNKVDAYASHFAYMPQEDMLVPWMSILKNICLYGSLHNKVDIQKAKDLMERFGLKGYEDAYPAMLSGGMRQRAAFLRTIMCPADIILLDEPFGALDIITREEMQDWLAGIQKELKKTIVLVTHDIDEAIYLSDRILLLSEKPAKISKEIVIEEKEKSRDWLYSKTTLRQSIRKELQGSN